MTEVANRSQQTIYLAALNFLSPKKAGRSPDLIRIDLLAHFFIIDVMALNIYLLLTQLSQLLIYSQDHELLMF